MASIWVTGSSAGIGQQTALALVNGGHRVVLHARSNERAADAQKGVPGAAAVVIGDFSSLDQTRALAKAARSRGRLTRWSITLVLEVATAEGRSPRMGSTRYSR